MTDTNLLLFGEKMKKIIGSVLAVFFLAYSFGQNDVRLSSAQFSSHQRLYLAPLDGWKIHPSQIQHPVSHAVDLTGWENFKLTQISQEIAHATGRIDEWFSLAFVLDKSFEHMPLFLNRELWAATDVYIDGELIHAFGNTADPWTPFNPLLKKPVPVQLEAGKTHVLSLHFVYHARFFTQRELQMNPTNLHRLINLAGPAIVSKVDTDIKRTHIYGAISISLSLLLLFLFWILVILNPQEKIFRLIAWLSTVVLLTAISIFYNAFYEVSYTAEKIRFLCMITFQGLSTLLSLCILEWVLIHRISIWSKVFLVLILVTNLPAHLFSISFPFGMCFTALILYYSSLLYRHRRSIKRGQWAVVAAVISQILFTTLYIIVHKYSLDLFYEYERPLMTLSILGGPFFFMIYISMKIRETSDHVYEESQKVLQITKEKQELLASQNTLLEKQVEERTTELTHSLNNLKSTQKQLIQSEKMASLGELTAGIAHEIQNPLNFVNNFSEVSSELIEEMQVELDTGDMQEVRSIASDIKQNLKKINHHGKRADSIVKGMLQHSNSNTGDKEATDLNALIEEYLNLSYHGLRAKDKSFNAKWTTDLDPSLPHIEVVPQEIGRVILNIINNAFYAVNEKRQVSNGEYEPSLKLSTGRENGMALIRIQDNGTGIPTDTIDRIFQPFYTTKPTGQGTGLGLSMSYDIIKAHDGNLQVESKVGQGTVFTIRIPFT